MNWLLLIVLALFAVNMYIGWKKGMILIIMSFVTLICSVIVTTIAAPQLNRFVTDNTKIYESIRDNTYESLKKNGSVSGAVDMAGDEMGIDNAASVTVEDLGNQVDEFVKNVADRLPLPKGLQEKIGNVDIGRALSDGIAGMASGMEDIMTNIVSAYIAGMICSAGCYIVVFLIVYIILTILFRLVNGISRLPLINELNKGLGVLFGLLRGVITVWIFFIVLTVIYNTGFAQAAMTCVNDSAFLGWLFDNNLIMNILISIVMK